MPSDWKSELGNDRIPQRTWLKMPATGMESEFNIYLDGQEIIPEAYWKHPSAFIDAPILKRTKKSVQIPTGGAIYFDRGVIEVVTPLVEIGPGCAARVVRSVWEQIAFLRDQLTGWEKRTGHHVRMKAYSTHYNISFELSPKEQTPDRNIKRLALLLAYILPIPVALVAANRRSTGIGVRPRGNRIEITVDFTPDPGLMVATAALIIGLVRATIEWPSYRLSLLRELPLPTVQGVIPGKHTTRKGWLTKDFHYPQSPFTSDIDMKMWQTRDGRVLSLREIGLEVAWYFRTSIRRFADPFSLRLLFAILEGEAISMLELADRPAAYEDVGRLCRWGMVIPELKSYEHERIIVPAKNALWDLGTFGGFIEERERERSRFIDGRSHSTGRPQLTESKREPGDPAKSAADAATPAPAPSPVRSSMSRGVARPRRIRRQADSEALLPPRKEYFDRRRPRKRQMFPERRKIERRVNTYAIPFPDRRLTRSSYEQVFLKLVSGNRLRLEGDLYTPVGMKGWYHAIFRRESDGAERLLTIDQLLQKMSDWQS